MPLPDTTARTPVPTPTRNDTIISTGTAGGLLLLLLLDEEPFMSFAFGGAIGVSTNVDGTKSNAMVSDKN